MGKRLIRRGQMPEKSQVGNWKSQACLLHTSDFPLQTLEHLTEKWGSRDGGYVIASTAKQSQAHAYDRDCFVAALLAMTYWGSFC